LIYQNKNINAIAMIKTVKATIAREQLATLEEVLTRRGIEFREIGETSNGRLSFEIDFTRAYQQILVEIEVSSIKWGKKFAENF
jgi:hypothetical protein